MKRLPLVAALTLLPLAACGNPGGGGGGGGVSCQVDPTQFFCGATDGAAGADTGGAPDLPVLPADATGTGDGPGPSDVPAADTVGGPCSPVGSTRCAGDVVQACGPGGWQDALACPDGTVCEAGACVPEGGDPCAGRECGPDGRGGSCGACAPDVPCNAAGQCEDGPCVGSCAGKACGDDGCGNACGFCGAGQTCNDAGQCVGGCVPSCAGKECGGDGCGGTCGSCPADYTCNASGQCVGGCVPSCSGKECGSDGCGGVCGFCSGFETCTEAGQCLGCVPSCAGKICGSDGCGGACGTCGAGTQCVGGTCQPTGGGGTTCGEILSCFGTCADTDDACFQACVLAGSAGAQEEFFSFNDCLAANACQSTLCTAQNCAAEAAACNFDKTGFGTCNGILSCLQGCPTGNAACATSCIEAGSAAAQAAYVAVIYCLTAACPDPNDDACSEAALTPPGGACVGYASTCVGN